MATPAGHRHARVGLAYGLSAYLIWGFIPLYFKLVADVPPLVVLCEPFTARHLLTFSLIWAALAIYSADSWSAARAQR